MLGNTNLQDFAIVHEYILINRFSEGKFEVFLAMPHLQLEDRNRKWSKYSTITGCPGH